MKKHKFILPVGLPASGKSTFREKYILDHPGTCVVSPDDIRMEMLDYERTGIDFDAEIENDVWKEVFKRLESCLECSSDVYFDATNLVPSNRMDILRRVDRSRFSLVAYFFNIDPYLALLRNGKRQRKVPPNRIFQMASFLVPPATCEGFDSVIEIKRRPSKKERHEIALLKKRD